MEISEELKMRGRSLIPIFIVAAIVIFELSAGCIGTPSHGTTPTPTATPTPTPTQAPQKLSGYITVKDGIGRTVKIKEPVEKVITLYGLAPPFLYLLGEGKKYYGGWIWGEQFYKLIDPNVTEKANLGRSLSIEEIVKIHPQLVIMPPWEANSRELSQLESLGIPVYVMKIESIHDIFYTLLTLGKVLGCENHAKQIVSYYNQSIQKFESIIKGAKAEPKVLVLYYSGHHHCFRTFGGDMFQSKLVKLAGGYPVSENLTGKHDIDVEQVAKWNPDYIFIIQYGVSGEKVKKEITSDPAWAGIKAVKEGHVYVVPYDGENWIDPCPKFILGLWWMGMVLHPGLFKGYNITKIANDFYEFAFHIPMSKVPISGDLKAAERE